MRCSWIGFLLLALGPALAEDAPKRLTPSKWDGKRIQTGAHCFYADKDEYRCMVGIVSGAELVRIDFSEIEPESMKKSIEDNCDTIEKMVLRPCSVTVIFTYAGNGRQESLNGRTTMFILAEDGKATMAQAAR
jgi:hypothetical protein